MLRVIGEPGGTSVRVEGTASAPDQDILQTIELIAERRGDVIHIESRLPQVSSSFWQILRSGVRALDLTIFVPAGTPVVATDGSGTAEFRGTGSLRVRDGSGDLTAEDVLGEVDITDGSGSIAVRNVIGPLRIRDSSGSILVDGVGEEVTINDGSGDIVVRNAGNVRIASDGSGDIEITDATGWVVVDSDGSGDINVSQVGGDFTVHSGGSGRINHRDVRGTISLPSRRRR